MFPAGARTSMKTLEEYLDQATQAHGHLCAGQVLGVRLAMLGLRELGIEDPIAERKRIITYVEIDRCVTDAVALVAGCRLGKRALKFLDWGKVAATFVDLKNGHAVRVGVSPEDLPGFKGPRVVCAECGEGINFKREVVANGRTLCRACAGERYYEPLS